MIFKNLLSAGLGLWFVLIPWVFGFADQTSALLVCGLLGALQLICSLLAIGKSGKNVWENWACFFIGAVFIVMPNLYHWGMMEFFVFVVLGFMTMLVNYSNLYSDD